ncbi:hypothetical protein FBZ98_105330 [Rhizobium sp. ERR 922]|uniref:Uncharacterized protein n=2 Tax=Rhizobium TaxID=379 RepID=A0A329YLW8_RHITR|nr:MULTISPECIES: hypothetical protein [Rhizobium]AYG67784.1 hypothetical protein CCGE531_18455 [Rhizobium sp. CCGE531]AYG74176.1 hypothetical protein CCGE532_17950 [Rhizobium sp. CCGE532]KAA1179524.1 hypothetical protein FP026_18320 [Rhizobium tropici]MBB3286482.1 hypothetical protein [Rhizobium sp. BK252]MBB3401324.1 hypothetical protein [Rhizobium sp. BK289]
MLLRTLAISALVLGMSSAAMAEQAHKHHPKRVNVEAFQADVGNVDHSKDAILPDGTINTDPSVTGPIRAGDSISRLQCAAAPNSVGARSSTYSAGSASLCP